MLIASISIFLSIVYAALLLRYRYGWHALPEWHIPEGWKPATRVSVIIPARNEAANIGACLDSIVAGSYPADLLEIVVVDDCSDDGTAMSVSQLSESLKLSEISSPRIALLQLADFIRPGEFVLSHKKRAIEIGIGHASGELIVTTDADCIAPKDWLRLVVSRFNPTPDPSPEGRGDVEDTVECFATNDTERSTVSSTSPLPVGEGSGVGLLAAPVAFHREQNLLQRFQSLDFLGLMGITGAGIHLGWQRMGNGANLAYPRAVFESVGGFAGNKNRASGDDMFLIQKIAARWPRSVFFLKNPGATVLTDAKPGWRSFLQQRLRWGTKNAALPEWPVRLALLTVFLFCWSILINSVLAALSAGGIVTSDVNFFAILLFQLAAKALSDYIFLREMCRFFSREDLLRWFVPSFFLHTLYIPLLGTASLFFKKYEWKGRQVN